MNKMVFCLLFFCVKVLAMEDIEGFWKTVSDETGEAQSIIAIYEHEGVRYGRIIGSFDENGAMDDSIYHPVKRAPGVVGNPFYSGLDIIWGLIDKGSKFKGKILDPEHGDVYSAELWRDGDDLVVRGKLLIFGRSQTWLRALKTDFPKGFKMPDLTKIVPSIPEVN